MNFEGLWRLRNDKVYKIKKVGEDFYGSPDFLAATWNGHGNAFVNNMREDSYDLMERISERDLRR